MLPSQHLFSKTLNLTGLKMSNVKSSPHGSGKPGILISEITQCLCSWLSVCLKAWLPSCLRTVCTLDLFCCSSCLLVSSYATLNVRDQSPSYSCSHHTSKRIFSSASWPFQCVTTYMKVEKLILQGCLVRISAVNTDIYSPVTVNAYVNDDNISDGLNCTDATAFRFDPVSFGSWRRSELPK